MVPLLLKPVFAEKSHPGVGSEGQIIFPFTLSVVLLIAPSIPPLLP